MDGNARDSDDDAFELPQRLRPLARAPDSSKSSDSDSEPLVRELLESELAAEEPAEAEWDLGFLREWRELERQALGAQPLPMVAYSSSLTEASSLVSVLMYCYKLEVRS